MSEYQIEIEIYEGKGGHLLKDGDTVIVDGSKGTVKKT